MTAIVGQLTPDDLVTFLSAQSVSAFASYDGHLPDDPDDVVALTMTGGPGMSLEGAFDDLTFQVRSRGSRNDDSSGLLLAWQVDYALVPPPLADPVYPVHMGVQLVSKIVRVGGGPAFLLRDASQRAHYTCNYIASVARV